MDCRKDTLCWECEKAGGKCSWSKNFTPVEGWNAIPTKISCGYKKNGTEPHFIDSFQVLECPEFEKMEELKRRAAEKKPKKKKYEQYTKYKTNDYAEIHRLHDLGKSYKEIANILGVSDKSIYRAMQRERKKQWSTK